MNPSALSLVFVLRFDPVVWLLWLAGALTYLIPYLRARRTPEGRAGWAPWRVACFGVGAVIALLALQSSAVSYTVNSMALYMGRLMVLAEVVPPLIVLSLPRPLLNMPVAGFLAFLLDPFVAAFVWAAIVIFWNLPASFSASVVSATTGTLLPFLYLFGGLLLWNKLLSPFGSRMGAAGRGLLGIVATVPMMIVGLVWISAPNVLYSPYVGVPCLWNSTPLGNQRVSGWTMMLADLPALAIAFGQLLAGLLAWMDSAGQQTDAQGAPVVRRVGIEVLQEGESDR